MQKVSSIVKFSKFVSQPIFHNIISLKKALKLHCALLISEFE